VHYAQKIQAFGTSKRAREEGVGDIVVGRLEDGEEVWTALYSERTKMSRMQQVHRGHGDTGIRKAKATTESAGSMYRVIPGMLDKLYASEASGTEESVHRDTTGDWYIHRCATTGRVYLIPALHAEDEDDVRRLVRGLLSNSPLYKYAMRMYDGLLVVFDLRPGCVRVKRTDGAWRAATEIETFAYYDFLLEPANARFYHFGKKARELDDELRKSSEHEAAKLFWRSAWTTVPREYAAANEDEDLQITMRRNRGRIYIGNYDDFYKNMSQISDVAWRLPPKRASEE
jgi:hypothetical protein